MHTQIITCNIIRMQIQISMNGRLPLKLLLLLSPLSRLIWITWNWVKRVIGRGGWRKIHFMVLFEFYRFPSEHYLVEIFEWLWLYWGIAFFSWGVVFFVCIEIGVTVDFHVITFEDLTYFFLELLDLSLSSMVIPKLLYLIIVKLFLLELIQANQYATKRKIPFLLKDLLHEKINAEPIFVM